VFYSIVALIPKKLSKNFIDQFKPIAMANFQYKIISKFLVDRLDQIAPKIISPHQRGFIQGRSILECVCVALEAFNLLDKKNLLW